MTAQGHTLDYRLLWDVEDQTPEWTKVQATLKAREWPGFPANPIRPVPIEVDMRKYMQTVKPKPPLGGRHTVRGRLGYVSLTNYNNLP